MSPVSLNEGLNDLRALATRSILYAFDFDGTLARISSDRRGVKLSPSTHGWLRELATRAPCAIISGRALSDLASRVNGAVPYLIGNHGLESPLTSPAAPDLWESLGECLAPGDRRERIGRLGPHAPPAAVRAVLYW